MLRFYDDAGNVIETHEHKGVEVHRPFVAFQGQGGINLVSAATAISKNAFHGDDETKFDDCRELGVPSNHP